MFCELNLYPRPLLEFPNCVSPKIVMNKAYAMLTVNPLINKVMNFM